jgi:formyl-CoA transferase
MSTPNTSADLPLSGIKVVDLSQVQMGPMATQMLADFGADVIKVERPGTGDISRTTDPEAQNVDESASFLSLNRNKRSLALDLKAPEAQEILDSLLAQADVLVLNYKAGGAERLGLGWERLHTRFPRLIYASGTGYGESGPMSRAGGQDMVLQSVAGASWHNRAPDGRPSLYPVPFVDFATGMALIQGVLLALIHRQVTDEGQRVDVSLFDSALFTQMQEYTQWLLRRVETHWENDNLVGSFPTSDGWVTVVGLFRPEPLRDLCAALGVQDLSARPEFATREAQSNNRAVLWGELDKTFASFTTEAAVHAITSAGMLCGPVLDYDAVLSHPQTAASGRLRTIDHPRLGPVTVVDNPIRMSAASQRPFRSPPLLGEHSTEVLREIDVAPERIAQLVSRGVVDQAGSLT